jgi:hypothetical protein
LHHPALKKASAYFASRVVAFVNAAKASVYFFDYTYSCPLLYHSLAVFCALLFATIQTVSKKNTTKRLINKYITANFIYKSNEPCTK